MKFALIGERSKIGQSIINYLKLNPTDWILVDINDNPDYLFLATSSDQSKNYFNQYNDKVKIVDFSGLFKEESLLQTGTFSYGFEPLISNFFPHISFPGCSSLASLIALNPLKNFIVPDSIFIDVKFSKSAIQRKSHRQQSIDSNQVEIVHPFSHYHEKEVNLALDNKLFVKMVHSVINVPHGIFLNVFFNLKNNFSIVDFYRNYYSNDDSVEIVSDENQFFVRNVINTNKTLIKVSQDQLRVSVSVIGDNLINGKAFNLLNNHHYDSSKLHNPLREISTISVDGSFASPRKHDIHTGIDLYCEENSDVFSMEDGIVMKNEPFTGSLVGSSWWEDTNYVGIKGKSGYIVYGEMTSNLLAGTVVKAGDKIGNVKRVLKKNKGKPQTMLHLEYYTEIIDDPVVWEINTPKPNLLLNPQLLLRKIK